MKAKRITIPSRHAESAAKGAENGTDCADYYHYFAGWSLSYVAHIAENGVMPQRYPGDDPDNCSHPVPLGRL